MAEPWKKGKHAWHLDEHMRSSNGPVHVSTASDIDHLLSASQKLRLHSHALEMGGVQ